MPAITLKNLPESLHAQLKERARRHHRSLNGELIAVLQDAVLAQESAPQPSSPPQRRPRPPLPSFHGGNEIPADFDLPAAIRAENAAYDERLVERLLAPQSPHDPA
jgi:plasmid stability protein